MNLRYRKFILLACFVFCFPGSVSGESNFDFFFKNSSQYQNVIVDEVRSANTIILKNKIGEKREVIKLIGLRAPKAPKIKKVDIKRDQYGFTRKQDVSPLTSVEELAYDFVKELLEGQHVRLEFDSEKSSEDFTTLAYVFLLKDEIFVNTEILRQGFAYLQIRPPNTKYANELREAYKEAHLEKRGLQGE